MSPRGLHSALETMEERIRKDLEDDRTDTEYELSRYEDAGFDA